MSGFRSVLHRLVHNLSEENYEETFAQYRFWFDVGSAHGHINDQYEVANDLAEIARSDLLRPSQGKIIHPSIHLYLRFLRDLEADATISRQGPRIKRGFAASVDWCFEENLSLADYSDYVEKNRHPSYVNELARRQVEFTRQINLVACWANLGYVKRVVIRDHILQSLTSLSKLYDHQADAIIILFKIAGATFGTISDPSVVDRCLELLKNRFSHNASRSRLVQEVLDLRDRDWEGLPPPPAFATEKLAPTGAGQKDKDPNETPVATSLGLPSTTYLEARIPQHPVPDPVTAETEAIPASPATQSPTISISTLSDFTIADTSDDEPPTDPTTITPHDTFNFEDGNVEVLCRNTLFRVHTSILSLHSPTLRRMFAQANLTTAESPNGCPRVQTSDTATDFAALLKMIYLPGFPERNVVPDFSTFSSLLRMSTKYEMPVVRSHLLEVVRDAYPETFEGVTPTKLYGEEIFAGPAPHPNEVLNLFIQQNLTSGLPIAYYMVARRGVDSLMDGRLPQSATLSPEVLRLATKGLMELRELELIEVYRLVLGFITSNTCSSTSCPLYRPTETPEEVIERITASSRSETRVLEVLSLGGIYGNDSDGFCEVCVKKWDAGHAEVRRRAWNMLPKVFGLKR